MGLLGRLFGTPRRKSERIRFEEATLYTGDERLEVVGESHYQDALWQIVGGRTGAPVRHQIQALLELEPDNPYDANAIRIRIDGYVVGYLSRDDAAAYRDGLVRLMAASPTRLVALEGQIVGGGPRGNGIGSLGVFLDHHPEDFGVRPRPPAVARTLRTGLSEAVATDVNDESYDLSWYRTLSDDDAIAIAQPRELLESEGDPIDRHYMCANWRSSFTRAARPPCAPSRTLTPSVHSITLRWRRSGLPSSRSSR